MTADASFLLKETHKSFPDRMFVLAELVGSVNKLARLAGVSQSGIRKYFEDVEPTRLVLIALAEAAGVGVEWLITGEGRMRNISMDACTMAVETFLRYCNGRDLENSHKTRVEFVRAYNDGVVARAAELTALSVYELKQWLNEYLEPASAQREFITAPFYDTDIEDEFSLTKIGEAAARKSALLSFRRDLVIDRWKLNADKLCVFSVNTEDLSPLLRPGDWVLCDCHEKITRRNGIYVLQQNKNIMFRRVMFVDNNRIRLMWENEIQNSTGERKSIVEDVKLSSVSFVGRIVWYGRRMRI